MCLSVIVHNPDTEESRGEHVGFEWITTHNNMGYRCGYVKVPQGHPWHGKDYSSIRADAHGGLTFSEPDEPCELPGPDVDWWVGFDCAHSSDAPDPSLPWPSWLKETNTRTGSTLLHGTVRTKEYVEAECKSLAEQAQAVSQTEL